MSEPKPLSENVRVFTTHSAEETIEVGRELAKFLDPPKVVLLRGDLGAGKNHAGEGNCRRTWSRRAGRSHQPHLHSDP